MQNAEGRMQNWVRWLSAFCILHSAFALACAAHRDTREQLSFWALGAEGDQIAPIVAEFERQNPSIHVVMQQIPWTAAHEKLLTAVVGEATPDVAQLGNTWIPEFAAVRALDELHGVDPRDHFAGVWATNVVDGPLCGSGQIGSCLGRAEDALLHQLSFRTRAQRPALVLLPHRAMLARA